MRDLRKSVGDPDTYSFITGMSLGLLLGDYGSRWSKYGIIASFLLTIVSTVLVWCLILDPLLRWWYRRKPVFRVIRITRSEVSDGTQAR